MDKVFCTMRMILLDMFIKVIGHMDQEMVLGITYIQMDLNIGANGKIIKNRGRDYILISKDKNTRDIGRIIEGMDRESCNFKIEQLWKATG